MSRSLLRLFATLAVLAVFTSACGSAADDTDADEEVPEGESDGADTLAAVEVGAGVTIDLAACPDDWSATQGADGDEIRIGISLPQSGSFAAFGAVAEGIAAYFDYVNETDPVADKDLVLIARDDAFEAGRSVANVEEMLEVDDIFAFFSIVGTANNAAVRPILNDACVPQLFSATGAPMFGDPVNFPWTIGGTLAYNTEASLWCQNIADEFGEGATVAGLFMNNDFGSAYQLAVEACAEAVETAGFQPGSGAKRARLGVLGVGVPVDPLEAVAKVEDRSGIEIQVAPILGLLGLNFVPDTSGQPDCRGEQSAENDAAHGHRSIPSR